MTDKARDCLSFQQVTSLSSAVGLTIPAGTETVLLQCETQNVRMRGDGSNPTTSVGNILIANTMYEFTVGQMSSMKFIEVSASAKLNVHCYGTKTA